MMKNVQQIKTIFPMGRNDDSNVWTTNFNPGARLITRNGRNERNKRNTRNIPNIRGLEWKNDINRSIIEIVTNEPSIIFQPELKYAIGP